MAIRMINHPGVEIREVDVSQYQPAIVGTYAAVLGFSDKGEDLTPFEVGNMQDYRSFFGSPTNEAERYAYYASSEVLKNGGSLIFGKLPYDNHYSNYYKALKLQLTTGAPNAVPTTGTTRAALLCGIYNSYVEMTATSAEITRDTYDYVVAGTSFTDPALDDELLHADFVIVNENKARLENENQDGGIFVKIIDTLDALKYQRNLNSNIYTNGVLSGASTMMDAITGLTSLSGIIDPVSYVNTLMDDLSGSSVSEGFMRYFPTIELSGNGDLVNTEYSNFITVLVCQTYADKQEEGKLSIAVLESFNGSIHKNKRDKATGQSLYIVDIVNGASQYIKMYQNPTSSGSDTPSVSALNDSIAVLSTDKAPTILGFSDADCTKNISTTSILSAMDLVLEKLSNIDAQQVDLVVDAGLSTIAEFNDNGTALYLPEDDTDDRAMTTNPANWRAVCDKLISFCKDTRKDCMAILDVPRNLVIEGREKYIRKTKPSNTFGTTIGRNLRYVSGLNSSYAAVYSNWMRMVDDFTGVNFWVPESVKAAGTYIYNDTVANIWDAPAGLNRGVVNGINDLSFNPSGKDADQLYMKSFNYAKLYPLDGFVIEGQKTTQVKPSAFDRVNVRRLFLRLERLVYQQARYFVYEPNNLYTRRRLIDTISPIFNEYKNRGGIYDYQIVCDTSNNTPDVIDRNELKVAILIKPVKTAEFILCDFIATRTGANFNEVLSEFVNS